MSSAFAFYFLSQPCWPLTYTLDLVKSVLIEAEIDSVEPLRRGSQQSGASASLDTISLADRPLFEIIQRIKARYMCPNSHLVTLP